MSTESVPPKRKRAGSDLPPPSAQEVSKKSTNAALRGEISNCFGVSVEALKKIDITGELFTFCVKEAQRLLDGTEHISTEKITRVKQLFFGIDFRDKSIAELQHPVDPISPHPIYVFSSLDDCLAKLSPYSGFRDVIAARTSYIDNDAQIKGIIDDPAASIQKIYKFCEEHRDDSDYSSFIPGTMDKLNKCPLYTAKDFLGTDYVNEVYILRGEVESAPQWVFKPTAQEYQDGYLLLQGDSDTAIHECTAHALNYHKKFPIPATYLVDIKGYRGSVQLFIDNTQDLQGGDEGRVSVLDMQKILIYDLLFSNTDRHPGNYLFRLSEGIIHVYGIDHDSCMGFGMGKLLKFEYIILGAVFNRAFMVELEELVSDDNLQRYEEIMAERGIGNKAIDWMYYSAKCVRQAIQEETLAKDVFSELKDKFEEEIR